MHDGIILIDKPAGITSFGVVARLRRVLSERAGKKVKVGHTGTLDPFATGLMIIVTGKACKDAMRYTKLDKVYKATIRLGQISITGDPEGEISAYDADEISSKPTTRQTDEFSQASDYSVKKTATPSLMQVQTVLAQFTGEIKQRPPIFSAIKINGQRAYKLARDGKEVEIPERTVQIYALELLSYSYPELKVRAHVSSGTYIRSLAVDIGVALGTGAYCQKLRRTRIADYDVAAAQQLRNFGITN
jgi:tRNA pseudouridine synthase B